MYYTSCIIQIDLNMNNTVNELLLAWEEVYKKGQLTFWIFLSLRDEKKYVDEIKKFVEEKSNYTMTCEEQSLYRILRKFEHVDVVAFELRKGFKGPDRKYYYLTDLGLELFEKFTERNIGILYSSEIKNLLKS